MQPLPIDPLLPRLTAELSRRGAAVLEAPPGAGKTTRVPLALLRAGLAGEGEIWIAEPRRLAARLAARRVAAELDEPLGETVGYAVRHERVASARTRLLYVTEGVLARRLVQDPRLDGVGAVVLDELHERHLETDLCLALLRRLRGARPDLALVVMSATLGAEPVARYLHPCSTLEAEGRLFPVRIEHAPGPDDRPLEKQVVSAVRTVLREGPEGDVLVFLPGARTIRLATAALEPLAESAGLLVLPLHGDLPVAAQARAVEPADRRKVVLSTNVAESSVTIDGVTAVVDSGLARVAGFSPWTGIPTLTLARISRASAAQRAGRAGRTAPGRVIRLYTRGDHDARPEHDLPEIARADLAAAELLLRAAGIGGVGAIEWLEPPPPAAAESAETLLVRLGACDAEGRITKVGRRMAALPLAPRLARVVAEGERLGVAEEACLAAALLEERDIRTAARTGFGASGKAAAIDAAGSSDVLELMDRFTEAEETGFDARRLRYLELDARAVRSVDRARRRLVRTTRDAADRPGSLEAVEAALCRALLAGFPDRVARRKRPRERELVLASGEVARLSETSVVHEAPLLLALDVEQGARGAGRGLVVRLASAVEHDWLLARDDDLLAMSEEHVFNPDTERVECVSRISYGSVVLEEERAPAPPSAAATEVLLRAARPRAAALFRGGDALDALVERVALLRRHLPEADLPDLDADAVAEGIARACEGCTRFDDLRGIDLPAVLLSALTPAQQALLREEAPERLTLPGGHGVRVHYDPGQPPWIASRLQDFFGMTETPAICRGRLPLTVHLLAPNQRAVQVTSDIKGFWERHYPALRRELGRRYPKHAWPEDGRTAAPPAARRG